MDLQNKDTISDRDEKWVEEQQINSWNPEIIISGFSLAFILAFPHSIYNFVVFMIQDWGMSFLAGILILMYLLMLVNVFKVFLILHLALRFAWAGFLGISYAFPSGVKTDKLFDFQKLDNYLSPKQMVLKLERICSMTFGIPLNMALIFIPLSIYLFILIGIHILFELEFFYLYLIFMGTIVLFAIFGMLAKKLNYKVSGENYLATIGALYSSNIGKWNYNIMIIGLFIITVPFVKSDSKYIFQYFNLINTDEDFLKWPKDDWYYANNRSAEERFSRVLLPSYYVENNILSICVAHYEEDYGFIPQLKDNFPTTLDTLSWGVPKKIKDLYKMYINDSLEVTSDWQAFQMPNTNQKAYRTEIDISHIEDGIQELRVEKLVVTMPFMFKKGEPRLRKNWSVVKFYKMHPIDHNDN